MTTRRAFLGSLMAATMVPNLTWADVGAPAFVAAAQEGDGGFSLIGLAASGADVFRIPLPARGHAATLHPTRAEVVAFARRPGTFAMVVDCASGKVGRRLQAPEGRAFNGHGAFSGDGAVLYTSEVENATGAGRIGLWARDEAYRRIGEWGSGGIGPHEIRRLADDVLVVANGGIQTGPLDREKLNIPTMIPNLTYLSGGAVVEQVTLAPEHHMASIRHLAVGPAGQVAFAMQWEGDVARAPALLGLHQRGLAPVLAMAPAEAHAQMQGYAGSVAFFGDQVAISSPKGGRVQVFDTAGRFATEILRADVCGLAPLGQALALTDGLGMFLTWQSGKVQTHQRSSRAWDNHLVAL